MKTLLTPFAWAASWLFYYAGDISCKLLELKDDTENLWLDIWFRSYQWNMQKSDEVQEWANGTGDRWPWQPVTAVQLEAEE